MLFAAFFALNKQQVTTIIGTIRMRIGGFTALMAFGDYFRSNALAQAVVEHKVLSYELAIEPLFFYLFGVVDNTAFEVKHIPEPIMQHISAGFLATNAAGAIHNDVLVLSGPSAYQPPWAAAR